MTTKTRKINIIHDLSALVSRKPVEEMSFLEKRQLPLPFKYRLLYLGGK